MSVSANQGVRLVGGIEIFTREKVRGWVAVDVGETRVPVTLVLEFDDWSATFEGPFIRRWADEDVGFEFDLPGRYVDLPYAAVVRKLRRLFARWTVDGVHGQADVPFFKSTMQSAVEDAARPAPRQRRVAVLLRTHVDSPKVRHLARQLDGIRDLDLLICPDETRGRLRVGNHAHTGHSVSRFAELGLFVRHPIIMWICGDYPFYAAALDRPEYDFFLMVEFDVALAREGQDWLGRFTQRLLDPTQPRIDFFAPRIERYGEGRGWFDHARKVGRFEQVHKSVFPIIGLSRRAIFHLFSKRLAEGQTETVAANRPIDPEGFGVSYCEVFVPSVLKADATFNCGTGADFGLPQSSPFFSVHRPLTLAAHDPDALAGVFAHPVLDRGDYLKKVEQFQKLDCNEADWQAFSRSVWTLPEDLRREPAIEAVWADKRFTPPGG